MTTVGGVLTELVNGAPVAAWMAIAAALGVASALIYWRCHVRVNARLAAEAAAAATARARRAATAAVADAPAAPAAPAPGASVGGAAPDAERAPGGGPGASASARYRAWLLSKRVRQLEARLAAQAASAPAETARAEATPVETAPDESASAPAEAPSEPSAPRWAIAAAPAPDGAPEVTETRAALEDRLERALAAAKLGRMSELAAIEREAAAAAAPATTRGAALFGVDLEGDGAPGSLRYRNWLLATALRRALDAARSGAELDADAIDAALTLAARPADEAAGADAEAAPAQGEADAAAPAQPEFDEEASALRYRAWRLRQLLSAVLQDAGAARSAAAAEAAAEIGLPTPDAGAAAPSAAAEPASGDAPRLRVALEEAEELRSRLAASEQALSALRADAAPSETALEALEAKARAAETELAAERARGTETRNAVDLAEARARAAIEAAEAAEAKAATAEDAADALRARMAPSLSAEQEARASRAAAATLRSRLWVAERRADERAALKDRIHQLETAMRELAEARSAQERENAQALSEADRAELADLRRRADRAAASDVALKTSLTEVEALRDRLAKTQSEIGRLTAQIQRGQQKLAGQAGVLGRVRSARARTQDRALAAGGEAATSAPAPAPARPSTSEPVASDPGSLTAALAAARAAPLTEAEEEARRLIEAGAVTAISSNRPAALSAGPPPGGGDDLTRIDGVTRRLQSFMNDAGLHQYRQLAAFSGQDIAWLDDRLALRGVAVSRRWVPQAAVLARATGPSGAAALSAARAMRSARVISGDAAAEDAAAGDAAAVGTEELAPPDIAAALEAPLFGVEAAALELLETAGFEATSENRPAAFEDPAPETASDDLALIQGVGPETAELLVAEGVRQFDTLARLDPADAAWLDRALGLGGRVVRERWIPQAQRWAAHKAAGGLHLGPEGRWTAKPAADPDNLVDLANVARGREAGADGTAAEGYLGGVEADALAILSAGGPPPGHAPAVELLSAASAGAPDDLQLIRGVDSRRETRMNALGLFHFSQLASLSAADLAWLDQALGLGGAAISERWREQAETLAAQKNDGDLQLGADGSWTMSARARALREVGALARAAPYTRAEIDATRLINSGIEAEDADRPNILLSDPSRGAKDDLKAIEGVGPRLEALLNDLGVYYYDQIASLSAEDIAWIDAKLRFKGRIVRDRWVVQAAELGRRAAEAGAGGGAGGDART